MLGKHPGARPVCLVALLAALWVGGPAGAQSNPDPAGFSVLIGHGGQTHPVACNVVEDSVRGNAYGRSDTRTFRRPDYFARGDGDYFDLRYARRSDSPAAADGGRCVTGAIPEITGDGTFSARLFIHPDVKNSDGVFTVAILSAAFSKTRELDLVVINLLENGRHVVKFGNPSHASSVDIELLEGRWVTVSMVRRGKFCSLSVRSDDGTELHADQHIQCKISEGEPDLGPNHIVINARAASDSGHDQSASVSLSGVAWIGQ